VATTVILVVVAAGIAIAYRMYGTRAVPEEVPAGSALTVAARQDLYGDAFNEQVLMRPGQLLTRAAVWIDDRGLGKLEEIAHLEAGATDRGERGLGVPIGVGVDLQQSELPERAADVVEPDCPSGPLPIKALGRKRNAARLTQ